MIYKTGEYKKRMLDTLESDMPHGSNVEQHVRTAVEIYRESSQEACEVHLQTNHHVIVTGRDAQPLVEANADTVKIYDTLLQQPLELVKKAQIILQFLGFPTTDPDVEYPDHLYFQGQHADNEALVVEINHQYARIKTAHEQDAISFTVKVLPKGTER